MGYAVIDLGKIRSDSKHLPLPEALCLLITLNCQLDKLSNVPQIQAEVTTAQIQQMLDYQLTSELLEDLNSLY